MDDKIEKEIDAIKSIMMTLQGLEEDVRKNVLDYVLKRLNLNIHSATPSQQYPLATEGLPLASGQSTNSGVDSMHIKQFKELKQPKTAIEMAVIVAFYLQYLAD